MDPSVFVVVAIYICQMREWRKAKGVNNFCYASTPSAINSKSRTHSFRFQRKCLYLNFWIPFHLRRIRRVCARHSHSCICWTDSRLYYHTRTASCQPANIEHQKVTVSLSRRRTHLLAWCALCASTIPCTICCSSSTGNEITTRQSKSFLPSSPVAPTKHSSECKVSFCWIWGMRRQRRRRWVNGNVRR